MKALLPILLASLLMLRGAANGQGKVPYRDPLENGEYINKKERYCFRVPEGWKVSNQGYRLQFREIEVTIDNLRADMEFHEKKDPWQVGRLLFDYKIMASQMMAGEVHIEIEISAFDKLGIISEIELTSNNLRELFKARKLRELAGVGLYGQELSFGKYGRWYNVNIYAKPPLSDENRRKISFLLNSFQFLRAVETDDSDPDWAGRGLNFRNARPQPPSPQLHIPQPAAP